MTYNYQSTVFPDPIAPPRPPLPSDGGLQLQAPPVRPPPPPALDTTDDESEDLFQNAPTASQGPIMVSSQIVKSIFHYYYACLFLDEKRGISREENKREKRENARPIIKLFGSFLRRK